MSIVKGGHAIMAALQMPDELISVAKLWVSDKPERSLPKHGGHVTLCFIGRDLEEEMGEQMLGAARIVLSQLPEAVETTGEFAMFGGKSDTLVALLSPSEALSRINATLTSTFALRNGWSYTPHLTLAVGTPGDRRPTVRCPRMTIPVRGIDVKCGDMIRGIARDW